MQILVELDGVLRSDTQSPIPAGVIMVGTLTVYNKITVMSSTDGNETDHWLKSHKIVDVDDVIDSSVGLATETLAERQIKLARSRGSVDLFITGNPAMWAFAFDMGIPSVLFGQPSYIRPEFRPDAPSRVRSWTDIEDAIVRQNVARTEDARLKRDSEGVRIE